MTFIFIGVLFGAVLGEIEALTALGQQPRIAQIMRFHHMRRQWAMVALLCIFGIYSAAEIWFISTGELKMNAFPWSAWLRGAIFLAAAAASLAIRLSKKIKTPTLRRNQIATFALLALAAALTYL